MKSTVLKSAFFLAALQLPTALYANPLFFGRAMRAAGACAAGSFLAHETVNGKAFAQQPNVQRHAAYAMTTTGFAGISGMYLASGIPAARPMGALFLGMAAWGHYLSYKQHHQKDPA